MMVSKVAEVVKPRGVDREVDVQINTGDDNITSASVEEHRCAITVT